MYSFTIKIANRIIGIESIHIRPKAICRDFIVSDPPELFIHISQEDIDRDRKEYERVIGYCEKWDGYIETFTLLRKLSDLLIDYGVFLLHGASIAVDEKAIVFVADSGTGKTTHIYKWLKRVPNTYVINGDKPFILMGENPMVCGSPWAGKENAYTNTMVPLKAIVLLHRSQNNEINRTSLFEAFPELFKQIYRPETKDKMHKTIEMLKQLNTTVSFWDFACNNFSDDCFEVAYNALMKMHVGSL